LLGLVVIPFFTSYLIRTIAWSTILADRGFVVRAMNAVGLTDVFEWLHIMDNGKLLNTPAAVIGGLTYNFLPFMLLPIYVSLEKIDINLVNAAGDLYSSATRAFRKVVFPLSIPGVFAGTLLTFIPAAGDFVNAQFLGNPNTTMIGNSIQDQFLKQNNYPVASAMAAVPSASTRRERARSSSQDPTATTARPTSMGAWWSFRMERRLPIPARSCTKAARSCRRGRPRSSPRAG
jgi:spermidine/putrescine transport system permease protein